MLVTSIFSFFHSIFYLSKNKFQILNHIYFVVYKYFLLFGFLHGSEMKGKNMLEREFASTGYQTCNHQVMSQTQPPLSHPGKAILMAVWNLVV